MHVLFLLLSRACSVRVCNSTHLPPPPYPPFLPLPLFQGGIVYSNKVTTVSSTYASDVRTASLGCNLEATFNVHR